MFGADLSTLIDENGAKSIDLRQSVLVASKQAKQAQKESKEAQKEWLRTIAEHKKKTRGTLRHIDDEIKKCVAQLDKIAKSMNRMVEPLIKAERTAVS